MAAGDTVIDGIGGRLALPVNGTELVAPAALWAIVSVEDFAPVVVGRNVRLTLHEAPAASVEPARQVELVSTRNSAAFVPLRLRLDKTRLPVPLLETVTAAMALALPT